MLRKGILNNNIIAYLKLFLLFALAFTHIGTGKNALLYIFMHMNNFSLLRKLNNLVVFVCMLTLVVLSSHCQFQFFAIRIFTPCLVLC